MVMALLLEFIWIVVIGGEDWDGICWLKPIWVIKMVLLILYYHQ